ncbi:MAG: molybdopterin-guanine dinucleotide biosynthesis protein B [Coriobacteriales bacterium]|nr:molybdopterin-guanine dinucleotide biosynthesis protein B [Coriobacteriaceae bacterium]MDY2723441.1 molybdopterin-guanine dinucleotide biosynthesis protein B [Coriobacteriales bacterium]MDY5662399.1 molybdopterin-guanine dinucleotide biosynthesis protein B [Coriobacteriales bacterium]
MSTIPNITVTGWSNSGKTTFVTQVVKILADSGIKVAVIKHHGHAPGGVDQEGKDSWKYEQAGANPVILSSSAQYAIFVSTPDHEPTREELMERLPSSTELVVIEGFRSEAEGAVEVSRKATGKGPKLSPEERIALISDNEELCAEVAAQGKPVFGLEDFADVARFFCSYAGIDPTRVRG